MGNVRDFIPARFRTYVYGIFAFIGLVIGSFQVGFAAANMGQPVWLTVVLAVYAFVGTGIGFTAMTHTGESVSTD